MTTLVKMTFKNNRIFVLSSPELVHEIENYLTIHYVHVIFAKRKKSIFNGKKVERERQEEFFKRTSLTSISFQAGLLEWVYSLLRSLKQRFTLEISRVSFPYEDKRISLTDKWKAILRDDQQHDLEILLEDFNGISSQYTGYGKTTCLVALADLLPGQVLILSPSAVIDEICARGEQYAISIGKYDWERRVNILNPTGFLSSRYATQDAFSWLRNVENVLLDEAHHVTAKTWQDILTKKVKRARRIYGFTATPEIQEGKELSAEKPLRNLPIKSIHVVNFLGPVRVSRKNPTRIYLLRYRREITSPQSVYRFRKMDWRAALDHSFSQERFLAIFLEIFERFPERKFYIPIYSIDSGKRLYDFLTAHNSTGIFWSGKKTYPNSLRSLESIKAFLQQDVCHFLISTSVGGEGVDISGLNSIIPFSGMNFKTIVQTAGRSFRGKDLLYVLIYDIFNKRVDLQNTQKITIIRQEYSNIQEIK